MKRGVEGSRAKVKWEEGVAKEPLIRRVNQSYHIIMFFV